MSVNDTVSLINIHELSENSETLIYSSLTDIKENRGQKREAPKAARSRRRRRRGGGQEWKRGVPLPSRLGGLEERRTPPPSGVRGSSPAENGFWCIFSF